MFFRPTLRERPTNHAPNHPAAKSALALVIALMLMAVLACGGDAAPGNGGDEGQQPRETQGVAGATPAAATEVPSRASAGMDREPTSQPARTTPASAGATSETDPATTQTGRRTTPTTAPTQQTTPTPAVPPTPGPTPTPAEPAATPLPTARPPVANPSVETDRQALSAFYDASNGRVWESSYTWMEDTPLGEWHGVKTNPEGRVTELELHYIQPSPSAEALSHLGDLSELQKLHLSSFELRDGLPPEIENLSNLTHLEMSHVRIYGGLPPVISKVTSLETLYFFGTEVAGAIPPSLGNLSNLRNLTIPSAGLTGEIPPELGNLQALEELNLSSNELTGSLPQTFSSLQNLVNLDVSRNQISGELPQWLTTMPKLRGIIAQHNQLSGEISPAQDDWFISTGRGSGLSHNGFTGCISDALFEALERTIGGPNICKAHHKEDEDTLFAIQRALQGNTTWDPRRPYHQWEGISTDRQGRVVKITDESFFDQGGPIPDELGDLENLYVLDLTDTNRSGSIPDSLGNLRHLRRLDLDKNRLTGDIPASFANLKELRTLNLNNNNLTLSLPGLLATLDKLERVTVYSNKFSGCLPADRADEIGLRGNEARCP